MILRSFLLAVGQIGDPRFRKVLGLGVVLTFALLVAAYALLLWGVQALTGDAVTIPIIGEVRWLDDLLGFASFIFMMVLSFFLMVPVASAITSMFLDEVAQAVEDRHYPQLPPAPKVPFGDALRDTINYLGVLIAANVAALIVAAFVFPLWPLIFYALNGFLLGREYFTLAAMRRLGRERAKELRRRHRGTIWLAGVLMALPLSIPLVNLLIPILGAATFTHIFHALNDRRSA
ncbi:EI24 domain-containing protein [Seohaeicola zhoushanensis]|uniref:Membrane protein n=1 Tax=Seohaeicola zhoushanensis TaxID=1569283 RepID=A0A8J3GWE9_9RHOB|nr:EI24 domain-containing protein [Seohaeicola zhoushanensis]GHF48541.1 membrane protein [Seohaeicola zhoushanensis]